MIHYNWDKKESVKMVECVNNQAERYTVKDKLTVGKRYDVKNESEEFYFIIDNSNRVGGFFKRYFKEL